MPKLPQLFCLLAAVVLAACTSAASQLAPSEGNYVISARTDPNPAKLGANRIVVTVTNKNGMPVSGARVRVSAEARVSAGTTTRNMAVQAGDIEEDGGGNYSMHANLGMAGVWKVLVDVSKAGEGKGSKRFDFEVT